MVADGSPDETGGALEIVPFGDPSAGSLRLVGELDAATGDRLLDAGRAALAGGATALRLDLDGLRFCDSAGLRSLVLLSREVDGPLVLEQPSDMLVRLLEVTGLSDAFALA
jgi:anti-anti-sigma factor